MNTHRMNTPRRILIFFVSCLACVACQSNLNTPSERARDERSCPSHGLQANPQGLHRIGSVGGVGLNHPSVITVDPDEVAGPGYLSARLAAVDRFRNPAQDVVIIVADDFGRIHNKGKKSVYTVDESLFSLSLESLGSVEEDSSETLRKALAAELSSLSARAKLSHGALTFNMLLDMLSQVEGITLLAATPARVVFELGQARVTLQAAEVSGLDTPEIAAVLKKIVNDHTRKGVTQFVFNFSFTLEPCTEGRAPEHQTTPFATKALKNDPLYKFIHGKNAKITKMFLASSGNSGQKEAAQPANWPAVVGVSASKVNPVRSLVPDTRAGFSNYGEVMAPGSWLKLTDPLGRNGVGHDADEVILEGTSFSVLLATLFSALDLTQATPKCGIDKTSGVPKLAQSGDINRTLESAVSRCQKVRHKPYS